MKLSNEAYLGEVCATRSGRTRRTHRAWRPAALIAGLLATACTGTGQPETGNAIQAITFPPADAWTPIPQAGEGIGDINSDGGTAEREIVGNAQYPALYMVVSTDPADGIDYFYVRLRLDESPLDNAGTGLKQFGWGLLFDTDGDLNTYEYSLIVNSSGGGATGNKIVFGENTTTSKLGDPSDTADNVVETWTIALAQDPTVTVPNVTVSAADSCIGYLAPDDPTCDATDGDRDYFLDFAIPVAVLSTDPQLTMGGITVSSELRMLAGTSSSGQSLSWDVAGCDDKAGPTIAGCASDPVTLDGDLLDPDTDGLTNANDLDDDNDGIPDTLENDLRVNPDGDNDNDGIPNWRDASDQGDGTASACTDADADGQCDAPSLVYDADGDGVPNHLDLDADNDGIPDVVEAGHGYPDLGGNGMLDRVQVGTNGLYNSVETPTDSGALNYTPLDTDGDGTPDFLDLDSDGDGESDIVESGNAALDGDADGRVDDTVDNDQDGLMGTVDANGASYGYPGVDVRDPALDPDGDSIPDPYDVAETGPAPNSGDSDSDLIDDAAECPNPPGWPCPDTNGDGTPDYMDAAPPPVCGNSIVEAGEGCDDGNADNTDACTNACKITNTNACNGGPDGAIGNPSCASGYCDLTGGGAGVCSPVCGNSIVEAGEGCDDGNGIETDGCNNACRITNTNACNGGPDGAIGNDSCASGNCNTTGGDPGVCEPLCGNSIVEAGEGCDDGNTDDTDACNNACRVTNTNVCNGGPDGVIGNDSCASGFCDFTGGGAGVCSSLCGNSIVEAGEGCDDGNADDTDACNNACRVTNTNVCNGGPDGAIGNDSCASGFCDLTGGGAGVCSPLCGNSVVEAGEGCDDGNTDNADACTNACKITNTNACNGGPDGATGNDSCASGYCDLAGGDPGVCGPMPGCGNGIVEPNEGCDDGNGVDTDACNNNCRITNTNVCNGGPDGATGNDSCASGNCNTAGGDPGICEPLCGNGILEAGEGCDDGNANDTDACNNACRITNTNDCNGGPDGATGNDSCASGYCNTTDGDPGVCESVCGNGILEADEGCDDGNTDDTDACNNACKITNTNECNDDANGLTGNASCASGNCNTTDGDPGVCEPLCGNSILEAGEGCDDGNTDDGDECTAECKVPNGIACNADDVGLTGNESCDSGYCNMDGGAPGVCETPPGCGNGILEALEGCDDGNTDDGDNCTAECKIPDGVACNADDAGLTGNDSCDSGICDTTGGAPGVCEPENTCGNSVLEAGEGCDDGNTADGDNCTAECKVPTGGTCNVDTAGDTDDASCDSGVCSDQGVCIAPATITVSGGACNAGSDAQGLGTLVLVLLSLLLVPLVRRRRPGVRALAAITGAVLVLGAATGARAQIAGDFPVERFRLSGDRDGILDVEWGQVPERLDWDLGFWLGAEDDPLVVRDLMDGDEIGALVTHRVAGTLVGAVALFNRLQIGVELPLVLSQDTEQVSEVGAMDLRSVGLGDIRVSPKVQVLAKNGMYVAVAPSITLPTSGGSDFRGDSGATFAPELIASRVSGAFRLGGNLGYRARSKAQLADLAVDDEIFMRLGAGYRLDHERSGPPVELALTLAGSAGADSPISDANRNHLEMLGGATYSFSPNLEGILAAGVGLRQGFGTPDWRMVAAIRLSSRGAHADPDKDGLVGSKDQCPNDPEDVDSFQDSDGCPDLDNDQDGVPDVEDGAPMDPEDKDGFADSDGVPDPDNDNDGLADSADACPNDAEVQNGYQDSDGCPDEVPDSDGDGMADNVDSCPNEAEDMDSFQDDDGCPDLDNDADGVVDTSDRCVNEPGVVENQGCPDTDRDGDTVVDRLDNCPDEPGSPDNRGCKKKQLVELKGDKLEILDKVYFATNKDIIQRRSYGLLRNVAQVLNSHPEVTKIEVEGHTDDQGNDDFNMDLSQRRANAVVKFLIKEGVAEERLAPIGYGETRPVDDNTTKAGRANNRRVEFTLSR